MIFSSIPFLYYFLPVVLAVYYLVPRRIKNITLLLASLVFYAWGEPACLFLMAGSILMGYIAGLLIEKWRDRKATVCMIFAIAINLFALGYFKYANFFLMNLNAVAGTKLPALRVTLPIGISFYTFQIISYVIDVYRGKVKAQRNLITLATYIAMFPQLIAGPIVRYADVEQQLQNRELSLEKITCGIRRFVLGLSKKVLIANVFAEFCKSFWAADEKSVLFYWAYAVAVSLQIYFDFSGYSDMAVGLGSMLGFHFPENFNYPFVSKSITEFWRRWHISLGSWFRDYVYIPLGGNRCSFLKNLRNILIVWCLTGLWHGAEWNFVLWGLYFAVLLMAEKNCYMEKLEKMPVFSHIYTLFFLIISFVLFDASSLRDFGNTIGCMFGAGSIPMCSAETLYYIKSYCVLFGIAMIGATPIPKILLAKLKVSHKMEHVLDALEPVCMVVLLVVVTAYLVDGFFNPFLYFRF